MALVRDTVKLLSICNKFFAWFAPLGDLVIRVWLFKEFFMSGLNKTRDWNTTLFLFNNEYNVPLLPGDIAAYLGTFTELLLPSVLLIGLFSRFTAVGLFAFNLVALYSYPFLWTDEGQAGFNQHILWAFMILIPIVHGPGKMSVDWLLSKKCSEYKY